MTDIIPGPRSPEPAPHKCLSVECARSHDNVDRFSAPRPVETEAASEPEPIYEPDGPPMSFEEAVRIGRAPQRARAAEAKVAELESQLAALAAAESRVTLLEQELANIESQADEMHQALAGLAASHPHFAGHFHRAANLYYTVRAVRSSPPAETT